MKCAPPSANSVQMTIMMSQMFGSVESNDKCLRGNHIRRDLLAIPLAVKGAELVLDRRRVEPLHRVNMRQRREGIVLLIMAMTR